MRTRHHWIAALVGLVGLIGGLAAVSLSGWEGTSADAAIITTDAEAAADIPAAVPRLILQLSTALDDGRQGVVRISTIRRGVLVDTTGAVVSTARVTNGIARFPLTGLAPGYYFIRLNGRGITDPVPTLIENPSVDMRQYVGKRLRQTVIGTLNAPKYRIRTWSVGQGYPQVVKYTDGLTATPAGNAFLIMEPAAGWLEFRYLDTAELINSYRHGSYHDFATFIIGPLSHKTSAFNCVGCHGPRPLTDKPPLYSQTKRRYGWCYKCHYGPSGPGSAGIVHPAQ